MTTKRLDEISAAINKARATDDDARPIADILGDYFAVGPARQAVIDATPDYADYTEEAFRRDEESRAAHGTNMPGGWVTY